ncbi:hypothetical protein PILCRDRAFT_605695 [Piloderma croceum F 1598]|uniref:Uncharacterized protein n=1 Tax=Piloderma croceum (strain F 1598) TaxID=765440 RepID=A0A0C3AVA1_PILCF|nr:hypothetical protein PILCRDRAFT_605695 [Piloderma croceum F 1598]
MKSRWRCSCKSTLRIFQARVPKLIPPRLGSLSRQDTFILQSLHYHSIPAFSFESVTPAVAISSSACMHVSSLESFIPVANPKPDRRHVL